MTQFQCPCYGNTNDWKCNLTKPLGVPPPYVPAGTSPGWINTEGLCAQGYCGVPKNINAANTRRRGKAPDKLIFVMEWYDREADLIKKFTLTYYDIDKSCEISDLINHRRFLRRLKVDTVNLGNLIIGNVINIYGRQMTVTEYADSCTKQYLEPKQEQTFLLVRPHAVQCLGQIYEILDRNFRILRCRMAWFTEETANTFYRQYSAESFFKELILHVTSAPVVALVLVGENAIGRLIELAGDIDPGKAKLKNAMSLRAVYGQNIVFGGVDVSETPECVIRDTAFFFTECRLLLPRLAPVAMIGKCSSLGIIKPHAMQAGLAGKIMHDIVTAGFQITALEMFYLDRTHAEEHYEIYKGVLPEFSAMTNELSIGSSIVMEISGCGENTVKAFRELAGPMDPVLARKLRPDSLRAKYGISKVENAVHCTDLDDDGEMEPTLRTDLLDAFLKHCQQTFCVYLYSTTTTILQPRENTDKLLQHQTEWMTSIQNGSRKPSWNPSESDNILPLYLAVFQILRLSPSCIVQLPSVTRLDYNDFNKWKRVLSLIAPQMSARRGSPDFILLPTSISGNEDHPRIPLPQFFRPKVILMSNNDDSVYMICMSCLELKNAIGSFGNANAHFATVLIPVVTIDTKSIQKFSDILEFWTKIHLDLHNPSYLNGVPRCYTPTFCDRTLSNLYMKFDKTDCLHEFIHAHFNGTSCVNHFIHRKIALQYPFEPIDDPESIYMHQGYQMGRQFKRYHILFFDGIKNKLSANLTALLRPLTNAIWIFTLLSMIGLEIVFKLTNLKNGIFWTIAVLLENEDDRRKYANVGNSFSILMWLFTAFLLRNLYTFSLYSLITKEPSPQLPLSLTHLLHNTSYHLMAVTLTSKVMLILNSLEKPVNATLTTTIGMYPHEFPQRYENPMGCFIYRSESASYDINFFGSFVRNLTTFQPTSCYFLEEYRHVRKTVKLGHRYIQHDTNSKLIRFALLVEFEQDDLEWLTFIFKYVGQRKPYEVRGSFEDPFVSSYVRVMFWKTRHFFMEFYDKAIGGLIQGGIVRQHYFYFQALNSAKKLKHLVEGEQRKYYGIKPVFGALGNPSRRWNFYGILFGKLVGSKFLELEFTPADVESMRVVWEIYILLMTGCSVVVIIEKIGVSWKIWAVQSKYFQKGTYNVSSTTFRNTYRWRWVFGKIQVAKMFTLSVPTEVKTG
ncbi:unnamed protein product [Orchesella dallaii]|uniref:DM10 domain-containing protein n=1 Tax=Orchesella dallaii TaxID=48710 RepID=A0ABP1S210_9HEXA